MKIENTINKLVTAIVIVWAISFSLLVMSLVAYLSAGEPNGIVYGFLNAGVVTSCVLATLNVAEIILATEEVRRSR